MGLSCCQWMKYIKYIERKTIDWNNEYKSIAMEYNGNYIYMMLDNKGIIVNGESMIWDIQ